MSFAEIHPLANPPKPLKDKETGYELTYRTQWARILVREQLARDLNILQSLPSLETPGGFQGIVPGQAPWSRDNLPPRTTSPQKAISDYKRNKIHHDYYDVGAMRFPDIEVMKRTLDLSKRTGTSKIPYYYSEGTVNCPMLFNDVRLLKSKHSPEWSTNPFNVNDVPDIYACGNPGSIMSSAIEEYVDALNKDPNEGFKKLMEVDQYSVRDYLSQKTQYNDYRGIEYLETLAGSTTSFKGAFSEYVIDSIDFAANEWWCIEGGVEVLAQSMWKKLRTKPQLKKKVTRIARPKFPIPPQRVPSPPIPVFVNIESADEALPYDTITECDITSAGVGSTDELIRTRVYPSYNLHDGEQNPAVLLCSYSWRQDSLRIGSLVHPDSPNGEDELKEVVLQGLARLHDIGYDLIKSLYVTHHAWNWYQGPNTMGAFASFGPADFSTLLPYFTRPAAGGMLHFAGEAISAHHAWIVGALDSGYRAVNAFFEKFGLTHEKQMLEKEFGPPPGELEVGDEGTDHLQVFLGSLNDKDRERLEAAMFKIQQVTVRPVPK